MVSRSTKPIPAIRSLAPLAGRWHTTLRWSKATHQLVGGPAELQGEAEFAWMEGGRFLHYQFATSDWIIGRDEGSPEFTVLYGDERPASRVYRMTLARGVWRIWRDAPGFHQRFEGRFEDKNRIIRAAWHRSSNGKKWVHDFDLVYTRIDPAPRRKSREGRATSPAAGRNRSGGIGRGRR